MYNINKKTILEHICDVLRQNRKLNRFFKNATVSHLAKNGQNQKANQRPRDL